MSITLPTGILIAFEGIDGAGKTTQASSLTTFLSDKGFQVVSTKEPTKGPWGQIIRRSARAGRLSAEEELDAFIKDRAEHVEQVIQPALEAGQVVIVDRYYFSTVAYQGARGMNVDTLMALNESFAPEPDLLVILDIDPHAGLQRVAGRGDKADLFENRDALTKSRAIFRAMDKPFALHLDATQSIEHIEQTIRGNLYRGPLMSRLCPDTRVYGRPCNHWGRTSTCPWSRLTGFEAPSKSAIDGIVGDSSLSDPEKIEMIRESYAKSV